jgi:hypothetical protein
MGSEAGVIGLASGMRRISHRRCASVAKERGQCAKLKQEDSGYDSGLEN